MKAILPFMGFTENSGYASGVEELWFNVLRPLSSASVTIYHPQEWDKDVRQLLSQMRRLHISEVMLIGYSWGAGHGAINFARYARNYGVKIPIACFCDPVYRSRFLPSWLPINPLSLTRFPKIKIPPSIKNVHWVRQTLSHPKGHHLIPSDSTSTRIFLSQVLDSPHNRIDERDEWFSMVKKHAEIFANSPKQ